MAEICDLSDLPADQCACRIHGPSDGRHQSDVPSGPQTIAKYDGECIECFEEIRAGVDVLVFSPWSGWVHRECL